jgi:hypothetical protein
MALQLALKPRRLLHQPQPVLDRWVRRWVNRKLTPKFNAIARAWARKRILRRERIQQKALVDAFDNTVRSAIKNEDGGFPPASVLFNIALYLLIAERDIQAVKLDALTHPDEWTRKLNARVILLTIYEWDADKVSGRSLKDALDMLEAPEDLRRECVEILRRLRLVQRRAHKQFSFVRNSTIAHRDPDALLQYRAIRELKTELVIDLAADFYVEVRTFLPLLSQLLRECSPMRRFLRERKQSSAGGVVGT